MEAHLAVCKVSIAKNVFPLALGPASIDDVDLCVGRVDQVRSGPHIGRVDVSRREVAHPDAEIDGTGTWIAIVNSDLDLV